MINPLDLRIGNYIEGTQLGGGFYRVCGIKQTKDYDYGILVEDVQHWVDPRLNDAIPITPDILRRLGFFVRKANCEAVLSFMHNSTHLILESCKSAPDDYFLFPGLWQPCYKMKHVHELQNLYKALVGKDFLVQLA